MIKVNFEGYEPCPIDSSVMCENSNCEERVEGMNTSLVYRCKGKRCNMFDFFIIDNEVCVVRK